MLLKKNTYVILPIKCKHAVNSIHGPFSIQRLQVNNLQYKQINKLNRIYNSHILPIWYSYRMPKDNINTSIKLGCFKRKGQF